MPARDRRSEILSVLFSETIAGGATLDADRRDPASILDDGAVLGFRIRVRLPDLSVFERRNVGRGSIVDGEVSLDGVLPPTRLEPGSPIRLVRDGRIAGISTISFRAHAMEPNGERLTFDVRRTLDPLGRPYDSTVELRRRGRLVGRGILFDPPRGYDQHITDLRVVGHRDERARKRGERRFLTAIRSAPRRVRPKDDEVALWVATLLEFLHEQEPGGPTVEDVQAQYMLMLDRVPRWRRTTIVDFLKRSLGVLRFFREATRVLIRNPLSRVVNTEALDAAHNLYQFLYYTLDRSGPLVGHEAMPLQGPGRRPRLRPPATASFEDLGARRTDEGWTVDGFDVVIVGSGPAGSLLAHRLSATKRVLVLEKGPAVAEGVHRGSENAEFEAYTRLYEGAGLQAANDDWDELNKAHGSIFILQGSCVGGGAMVNNSICVRMSDAQIERWRRAGFPFDGLGHLGRGRTPQGIFSSAYRAVVDDLDIVPLRDAVKRGAPRNPIEHRLADWKAEPDRTPSPNMRRLPTGEGWTQLLLAKKECQGCGFCNVGCAYGAKRSPYEVYLRAALDDADHDLTVVADAEVVEVKLDDSGDEVDHLVVTMPDPSDPAGGTRRVRIRAPRFILAAGAVGSPLLLLKSPDIRDLAVARSVGTRFTANIAVPLIAVYRDESMAETPRGLQMTHSYVPDPGESEEGYVIETWWSEPGGFALGVPGYFSTHRAHMKQYRSSAAAVVLAGSHHSLGSIHWYDPDDPRMRDPALEKLGIRPDPRRGRHTLARPHIVLQTRKKQRDGRLDPHAQRLEDSLRSGLRRLAEQMLKGSEGRLEYILVPSRHGWKIRTEADVKRILGENADSLDQRTPPHRGELRDVRSLRMTSAHPQGGNPMLERDGVVGGDFRVRGLRNLRVCDASIFPDNAGVNPQWTVLALAQLCADTIAHEDTQGENR